MPAWGGQATPVQAFHALLPLQDPNLYGLLRLLQHPRLDHLGHWGPVGMVEPVVQHKL